MSSTAKAPSSKWVMERYQITTHKDSSIINVPNDWAAGCGNPRYIPDLLLSVIHVSTQTVEVVEGLPAVQICNYSARLRAG